MNRGALNEKEKKEKIIKMDDKLCMSGKEREREIGSEREKLYHNINFTTIPILKGDRVILKRWIYLKATREKGQTRKYK